MAAAAGSLCLVHVWLTDKRSCCWQEVSSSHLIDVWHADNGGEEIVGVAHSSIVCQDISVCEEAITPIAHRGLPSALQKRLLTHHVTGSHCLRSSLKVCRVCALDRSPTESPPGEHQIVSKIPTSLASLDYEPGLCQMRHTPYPPHSWRVIDCISAPCSEHVNRL